jgi:hypothetical protein
MLITIYVRLLFTQHDKKGINTPLPISAPFMFLITLFWFYVFNIIFPKSLSIFLIDLLDVYSSSSLSEAIMTASKRPMVALAVYPSQAYRVGNLALSFLGCCLLILNHGMWTTLSLPGSLTFILFLSHSQDVWSLLCEVYSLVAILSVVNQSLLNIMAGCPPTL